MFTTKIKALIVSGKMNLIIRVAFLTLVLLSSLAGGGQALAFAGPIPGGVGG